MCKCWKADRSGSMGVCIFFSCCSLFSIKYKQGHELHVRICVQMFHVKNENAQHNLVHGVAE
jgi:hypothetical protein